MIGGSAAFLLGSGSVSFGQALGSGCAGKEGGKTGLEGSVVVGGMRWGYHITWGLTCSGSIRV